MADTHLPRPRKPRRWLLAVVASLASVTLAEIALHVLDLPGPANRVPDLQTTGLALDGEALFVQALLADRYDPSFAQFTAPVRIELRK